ncbi:MAG: OmpH family outer membrane protein [Salibacteraceae bacterium]|jgi:outer membrane protein|nr:OmpH family outer membrane protein [Salibacteraceae bacterium]MDP4687087.1 OmpH family outer membrane protein [Salibacteraceae bacterium]MDP4764538.1 OmpH family outer membrane protein [Salibacteraceae bacterium]MDP4843083.1 OmpH family outer membrane protein [Salibacteraceae bacterium]MDP4933288.1 OmpH family outer membrane protein [Salibacteraceae bacterium]
MKSKSIFLAAIAIMIALNTQAQRYAFIDTDYILEQIPAYQEAQTEIDAQAEKWQKQIEARYAEIEKMYTAYKAEQVLLTPEMKKNREDEIINKEKEAKDFQKEKFGVDGALFKLRQELIKPIQESVFEAVQKMADQKSYAVIFDKAASSSALIYANPKYDQSEEVLQRLGFTPESE